MSHLIVLSHPTVVGRTGTQHTLLLHASESTSGHTLFWVSPHLCPPLSPSPRKPCDHSLRIGDWASHPRDSQSLRFPPENLCSVTAQLPEVSLQSPFTSIPAGLLSSPGSQVQYFTAPIVGLLSNKETECLVWFLREESLRPELGDV